MSPFQQEKTPSFYVHPQKDFLNVLVQGETGDAISFVQKVENLEFQEALEFLSQRFGIPLKYESGNSNSNSFVKSIRSELHSINEAAKYWFMQQLKSKTKKKVNPLGNIGSTKENLPKKRPTNLELGMLQRANSRFLIIYPKRISSRKS